ncbi:MAG: radical SAM protein [Oscillospiraceae bacterium]|nr:radical SAM protein [Oscillospiraceae bacterium]
MYLKKEKEKKRAKRFRALAQTHPCLSCGSAPNNKGRVHLPVSAACNIQCRFCQRACNACDDRPGVANGILQAEEADAIVEKALALCPELTVVGVAGPGDSLASPHALEAFRRVHAKYPELIMCMSTNGLALPGKIPELQAVGVKTITVTVNAVDPVILEKIVSHIVYGGRLLCGAEAGEILIRNQLRGIREASDAGIIVKVNTVLIPGVNDEHIASIAREIADAGAMLHNILPLIPQHELRDIPAPTCQQINDARAKAGEYIQQFLHCKHCRADACGIPGQSDLSSQLYDGKAMETFSHG